MIGGICVWRCSSVPYSSRTGRASIVPCHARGLDSQGPAFPRPGMMASSPDRPPPPYCLGQVGAVPALCPPCDRATASVPGACRRLACRRRPVRPPASTCAWRGGQFASSQARVSVRKVVKSVIGGCSHSSAIKLGRFRREEGNHHPGQTASVRGLRGNPRCLTRLCTKIMPQSTYANRPKYCGVTTTPYSGDLPQAAALANASDTHHAWRIFPKSLFRCVGRFRYCRVVIPSDVVYKGVSGRARRRCRVVMHGRIAGSWLGFWTGRWGNMTSRPLNWSGRTCAASAAGSGVRHGRLWNFVAGRAIGRQPIGLIQWRPASMACTAASRSSAVVLSLPGPMQAGPSQVEPLPSRSRHR